MFIFMEKKNSSLSVVSQITIINDENHGSFHLTFDLLSLSPRMKWRFQELELETPVLNNISKY